MKKYSLSKLTKPTSFIFKKVKSVEKLSVGTDLLEQKLPIQILTKKLDGLSQMMTLEIKQRQFQFKQLYRFIMELKKTSKCQCNDQIYQTNHYSSPLILTQSKLQNWGQYSNYIDKESTLKKSKSKWKLDRIQSPSKYGLQSKTTSFSQLTRIPQFNSIEQQKIYFQTNSKLFGHFGQRQGKNFIGKKGISKLNSKVEQISSKINIFSQQIKKLQNEQSQLTKQLQYKLNDRTIIEDIKKLQDRMVQIQSHFPSVSILRTLSQAIQTVRLGTSCQVSSLKQQHFVQMGLISTQTQNNKEKIDGISEVLTQVMGLVMMLMKRFKGQKKGKEKLERIQEEDKEDESGEIQRKEQ